MIRNYIKMAWRNILRNFSYSIVNVLGLAAGLASFVVILLYLNYELSYDNWSPQNAKVYRVGIQEKQDIMENTPAPLAGLLAEKYPNAEAATMLQSSGDYETLLAAGDKKIYQKNIITVDSSFLKVFPYQLSQGNAATALDAPNAVIISKELSRKLFGDVDPMGKTIKAYNSMLCVVTGVLKDISGPTHLPASMLMRDQYGKQNIFWGNYSYQTYIKIRHPEADAKIEDGINRILYTEHLKSDDRNYEDYHKRPQATSLFVDALPNIHNFSKHGNNSFRTATVLLVLAVLLLLAGAINFSNLAIAQSMRRAKEVGVRKVLGSDRGQLVFQFMTETALQCLSSLGLAIIAINIGLPYINNAFDIHLSFLQQYGSISLFLEIIVCMILVIALSGLYPSLFLSRFNTTNVLKGDYTSGRKGKFMRNGLIVIQFMVSVFFITAVLVIHSQINYMETRDKGFSGTQVIRLQTEQKTREDNFNTMQQTLLTIPGVSSVAKTTKVPGDHLYIDTGTVSFKYDAKSYRMGSVKISKDYFRTMRIALLKGRQFTDDTEDQKTRSAIINQSAAKKMNLTNPIGKIINFPDCDSIPVRIVGVVNDFHESNFETAIQPEVYTIGNNACMFQSGGAVLIKIDGDHPAGTVASIEKAWKQIEPDFPLRYSFLDGNFQQMFSSYVRLQKIVTFFGSVALVISITGLFALSAFFIRRRTKEIGIRKVVGASVPQLATMLSKEFVFLVAFAVLITTPLSLWSMQQWLRNFAYHMDISVWLFLASGSIAVIIAIVTVSFQSIKAATSNPVDSLRND